MKISYVSLCIIMLISVFQPSCASGQSTGLYDEQDIPDTETIDRLVVYKDEAIMEAWSGTRLLKNYKVSTGLSDGPKRFQGDKRTPEGIYRIDSRHKSKKYRLFLHVSYPNDEDQKNYKKGLKDGTIEKGTGIGSAIGVHGEKSGYEKLPLGWFNWTAGCIAVSNDDIDELYERVIKNAVIEIWAEREEL